MKKLVKKALSMVLSVILITLTMVAMFSQTAMAADINLLESDAIVDDLVYYFINAANVNSYMSASNSTSGANVYLNTIDSDKLQKYQLVLSTTVSGVKYYNIIPYNNLSNRIDIHNAANVNGANVKVFADNPNYPSAQRFRFISNGDGTVRIMPQLSTTRVIEVANGSSSDGANIQIYDYTGATHQKWILKRAWEYSVNSNPGINSGFSRVNAANYAVAHGASPNFSDYPDTGLNCANFASQCIHEGGMPMLPNTIINLITSRTNTDYWFTKKVLGSTFWTSEMWSTTSGFYAHWADNTTRVYRVLEYHTGKDALRYFHVLTSALKKGDIIQYGTNTTIDHTMVVYDDNCECDGLHRGSLACAREGEDEILYAQNVSASSGNYKRGHLYYLLNQYDTNRFFFYQLCSS